MENLHLDEERHPIDRRPRRRWDESFLGKNWFSIVAVAVMLLAGFRDGGAWFFGRESTEREITARIERLEKERDEYVRKESIQGSLDLINYRLASIDARVKELSEQKRR